MRGKRSKAYRKLLKQYELAFNFRQPYQVLVDADLIKDAHRFAIDLPQYFENTLHGEVKILVTQCSMRHLYDAQKKQSEQYHNNNQSQKKAQQQQKQGGKEKQKQQQRQEEDVNNNVDMRRVIEKAKEFERRRCGHRPEEYPEPLGTLECLGECVGKTNKHRYVVASQDPEVRAKMRGIPGVPLIYISRSVMILEPMAHATAKVVNKGERAKFRAGLKEPAAAGTKRKREDGDDDDSEDADGEDGEGKKEVGPDKKKTNKKKGPKGPNPLSVKKAKKKAVTPSQPPTTSGTGAGKDAPAGEEEGGPAEQPAKKKRKRKQKKTDDAQAEGGGADDQQQQHVGSDDE